MANIEGVTIGDGVPAVRCLKFPDHLAVAIKAKQAGSSHRLLPPEIAKDPLITIGSPNHSVARGLHSVNSVTEDKLSQEHSLRAVDRRVLFRVSFSEVASSPDDENFIIGKRLNEGESTLNFS